jgi:hypothetical protein
MTLSLRRISLPAASFLATAGLAQAHPGHDGHDFTWDFGHLAAYPGATLLCFGFLAAVVRGVWKLTRPSEESAKLVRVRTDDVRRPR